jgi:alginate O-acetyltransferase complex protein AlgI
MVFSSVIFLFYFLPVVITGYYLLHWFASRHVKHAFLTLVSYFFYGWANPLFFVLMFLSTLFDYVCGLWMTGQLKRGADWKSPVPILAHGTQRHRYQRAALVLSICSNLALLGFFKYYNFGMDSWNALMQALGVHSATYENFLRITLPLGISFYTFQSMSYSIDVYRGDARAIRNWTDFSCYVSMFPQLVAGPIIRFQEVADQIANRTHTVEKFARGVSFIFMGMAKKIMLADPCGYVADTCFNSGGVGVVDAWYGVIAYAFQIYFDFSAYSDMAIGLGLTMGFMFAKNFDSPYISQSITEFWRRWHLSLSNWLRDYLYIPLGGNRKGEGRTYVNLMMVMLLGGLWHGASWNFVIWGAIHGGMLAFERMQGKDSPYRRLPRVLRIAITFVIVCIAWVFFRADTLGSALGYLAAMFGLADTAAGAALVSAQIHTTYHMATFVLAGAFAWFGTQTWDFTRRLTPARAAIVTALFVVAVIVLVATAFHPFIYFIF